MILITKSGDNVTNSSTDPGNPGFKVPLLRNVAMTAPYFHDGSVATLPEAVRIMATVQLDKTPSDHEVDDIVAFLSSLTGELPGNFATVPILPPGGPQ
jgi:cytochrome c peroxidase